MSTPLRAALADIATRFMILPSVLADALDEHGPDRTAWAWIDDGRLVRFEIDALAVTQSGTEQ